MRRIFKFAISNRGGVKAVGHRPVSPVNPRGGGTVSEVEGDVLGDVPHLDGGDAVVPARKVTNRPAAGDRGGGFLLGG